MIIAEQFVPFIRSIIKVVKVAMLAIVFLSLTMPAQATSPSSIELTYDQKARTLHIVVKHVTAHMRKHYIRKIEISKNAEKPVAHYYSSQTSASEQIVDISLKAKPHDTIHVEAVCSSAGRGAQDLIVPEE